MLFSDSRMDAAKLSTGIKLDHYRDTLRQVAYEQLAGEAAASVSQYAEALAVHESAVDLMALEKRQQDTQLTQEEFAQRQLILGTLPPEVSGEVLRHAAVGGAAPGRPDAPDPSGRFRLRIVQLTSRCGPAASARGRD